MKRVLLVVLLSIVLSACNTTAPKNVVAVAPEYPVITCDMFNSDVYKMAQLHATYIVDKLEVIKTIKDFGLSPTDEKMWIGMLEDILKLPPPASIEEIEPFVMSTYHVFKMNC